MRCKSIILLLLLSTSMLFYGCSSDTSADESTQADDIETTQRDISEYSELEILFHRPLVYSGDLKDGAANGEGTQYNEDGSVSYEGHWKRGEYDGEGTLYNSEGEEIYSGKWDNGDFAS